MLSLAHESWRIPAPYKIALGKNGKGPTSVGKSRRSSRLFLQRSVRNVCPTVAALEGDRTYSVIRLVPSLRKSRPDRGHAEHPASRRDDIAVHAGRAGMKDLHITQSAAVLQAMDRQSRRGAAL